jgi:pyruvate,orthophosphate dikinase
MCARGSEHEGEPEASGSLGEVLDEHAELEDLLAQLEAAADLGVLSGLLERLSSLLETHFAREEAAGSLLQLIEGGAPGSSRDAAELSEEHRQLLSAVRELIRELRAGGSRPGRAIEQTVAQVLTRLRQHQARETELLRAVVGRDRAAIAGSEAPPPASAEAATNSEPGARREGESDPLPGAASGALQVNLRRTAVDVVIPAEQTVLLDITRELHGLHESTKKLLREINHRYVGWPQTLEDLHRHAMGDFAHYIGHERAAEAIEVFCSLYAMAAEAAAPAELRENAVRKYAYFLEKIAMSSGERLPSLLPPLERALSRLRGVFQRDPRLGVIASPRLRRFVEALVAAAPERANGALERAVELLSTSLRQVCAHWLACEDPEQWWRDLSGAGADTPPPPEVAAISHARLRHALNQLEQRTPDALPGAQAKALFELPDHGQIERGYLDAAGCVESEANDPWQNQLERIRWLIQVVSLDALASVHERALIEISHSYLDVLRGADRVRLEHFVRETFASLRQSDMSCSATALDLIEKVGVEVLATADPERAELVIDQILDWDFPAPEFSGFTDEWQVQVNPAHLRAIRTYLRLIERCPELARPLIAALVVHLKIGGVFMADTDLFQKDVSSLLNSQIEPVYNQVRHALKLFPVYFNDIGAEGELRDVSSRIDEIGGRKDPLCHFLRKQAHVESNPLLIGFCEAIGHFWATGERAPLERYVPAPLYETLDVCSEEHAGLHDVFRRLAGPNGVESLFALELPEIGRRLEQIPARSVDREKAELLFRVRKLIGRKYELDHEDLLERLAGFPRIADERIESLQRALGDDDLECALELLLELAEQLKDIILAEERTEGIEDIYRKRHIAVGIPSMYGRYREEKFEAMGLSLRIESLAGVLFERLISGHSLEYVTRNTLQRVARWLPMLLRALRIDGCQGRGLSSGIAMLNQALLAEGVSVDQYINIFQSLSRSVEQVIRIRFLEGYEPILERLLRRRLERGVLDADEADDPREAVLKVSEAFLRDLIAESFGLQQLDSLVGKVLRSLVEGREKLDPATLRLLMTCDPDHCCVAIDRHEDPHDGAVYLGNKGELIRRLAREGLPVPDGFILTTEVFRCHAAILACDELRRDISRQIQEQVSRLESLSDARFGDPERPLLLSVRSGAAISMPGILDTFLNVGMSAEVAEGLAARSGSAWGAWDAYRRFHQFWGMGHGIDRDLFDGLMREAKQEFGVEKKAHLPAENMKRVALRYRDLVLDRGIEILEDPFEQLFACVGLVLRSWDSDMARMYRGELRIAEEWGTAVIVQRMVFGNLHERSGTGVVMTRDPRASGDVRLYGDFIVQGQGDDVVSGLVETFPITEEQRRAESKRATLSLEKDFPDIYRAMRAHARTLVHDQGMFHQEIEFTFESEDPADLYILQTRDTVMAQVSSVPAFLPSEALEAARLANGIGAGGGALSGRVAHTAADIAELRRRFPGDPVILLRPDTVPDDIPLILQADGMVTARGGATSHAAVAALRLGRTCVVGCRELSVDEGRGRSSLSGRSIAMGDLLSINGMDGSIYLGSHASTMVRRQRLI